MTPTPPAARNLLRQSRALQTRGVYARSPYNMLVGGGWQMDWPTAGPGINPGDSPPIWWYGTDSGSGATPIGPNGPFAQGTGPGLPVVVRATSLITGPLTAAPFRELDLADGHPITRARWITDPMQNRVDQRFANDVYPSVLKLSRGHFWAEWVRSALWFGTGAFITQLDDIGQPLAGSLKLVNPALLTTERDDFGVLHWVLGAEGAADEKAVFDRDGSLQVGPVLYQLVVLRNPLSPVDSEGHSMGVFEMSPQAFRLESQIESYASGTFRSGIPAGYLQVNGPVGSSLTQEQADGLKTQWMRNHGGDRRSIAVLNAATSFVPLNMSPVDAALGEVKRLSIADVAMAFGLSPDNLGVSLSGSATYSNVRDHFQALKDFGLAPWISGVEDTLTALLPGSQGVKVNLDSFANPPLKERVETGAAAVAAGLMTVDEWRASEGFGPMPAVPDAPPPDTGAIP